MKQMIAKYTCRDTHFAMKEFNNRIDWAGDILRSEGGLPFADKGHFGQDRASAKRAFGDAIAHYLGKNEFVYVNASNCMWEWYEKPQPMFSGAAQWANAHDKPILPTFTTFAPKQDGGKVVTINVGRPIQNDLSLSKAENVERMMKNAALWQRSVYEKTYNRELSYNTSAQINSLLRSGVSAEQIHAATQEKSI